MCAFHSRCGAHRPGVVFSSQSLIPMMDQRTGVASVFSNARALRPSLVIKTCSPTPEPTPEPEANIGIGTGGGNVGAGTSD